MSSAMKMDFICKEPQPQETDEVGISDNENSEDEQLEYAAWQDVDLNPAVELVAKLVRESLDAGKTYNKSITAKTSQLLIGCDDLLLEMKILTEARAESRLRSVQRRGQGSGCACGQAMAMLPLRNPQECLSVTGENDDASKKKKQMVDETTEDHTDNVLVKMEATMMRLKEMAELIQATSMQGEANLVSKVSLQSGTFQALEAAVQASAAAATATAIAQERGRSSSAFGRLCMPIQVQKLQEWYYSYPRPLLDELTLMRTILNYRPYANPFQVGGLTLAHVRDWFKRRRFRERMRYVKLAVEAGHDAQAAEEEIDLRLEQRIAHLRASVDPNDLVKEVDSVRAQSYLYDAAVNAFTRPNNIRSYIAASHSVPTTAEQHGSNANGRGKRQRTQNSDLDDIPIVKHATVLEVMALQNRLRSLMEQPKTTVVTNGLQQVVDLLRAMKVDPDVRIQSGLVADLKQVLKEYTKPTLLRKATIALLESLGMNRRAVAERDADDDAPLSAPASPALSTASSARGRTKLKFEHSPMEGLESSSAVFDDDSSLLLSEEPLKKKAKLPAEPRAKEKKGRVLRPMKFSMDQLTALEAWFQQKYKPSQEEMEDYLVQLNTPPLRDLKKQRVDVNMTQLRRWFNKRRCLRRPPFALMTQQEAAKEGSKNPAVLKAVSSPSNVVEPVESMNVDEAIVVANPEIEHRSYDDTNDDSSDDNNDDDDDDDDDDGDDDDDDDGSSDDGEHLIDQALA